MHFVRTPGTPPTSRWCSRMPCRSRSPQHPRGAADGFAGGRHPAPRFHRRWSRWGDKPRQAMQHAPDHPIRSSRAPLPTRFAIIGIPYRRNRKVASCRHACLPQDASTANSCAFSSSLPTSRPTTISRPSDTSRASKNSATGAASSSSNTGAQLGWHVLTLLRYVALPPPRVATSLHLATCRPSHGIQRVRQQ
jgi:hypothetical protein